MNLSSKSFWADINLGKDSVSLSNNNINYNKLKHHSIYFSNLVLERIAYEQKQIKKSEDMYRLEM
jgi:hypothetical protein